MSSHVHFGVPTPVIPAMDVDQSLRFYTALLGFTEVFRSGTPPDYAGLVRGETTLHIFACPDRKIGEWTMFRVRVDDVDALYVTADAAGIVHPSGALAPRPWGSREFTVVDPAGVCVTFWA